MRPEEVLHRVLYGEDVAASLTADYIYQRGRTCGLHISRVSKRRKTGKKGDALGTLRDTFLNGLLQIYSPQEMSTSL